MHIDNILNTYRIINKANKYSYPSKPQIRPDFNFYALIMEVNFIGHNFNILIEVIQIMHIQTMKVRKEIQEYISIQVNPIVTKLMADLIKEKPKRMLYFCRDWFQKKLDFQKTLRMIQEEEDYADSQEEMNEEEYREKLKSSKNLKKRVGICGDLSSEVQEILNFKPKFFKKKTLVKNRIMYRLKSNFLFKNLDQSEIALLTDVMQIVEVQEDEFVIKEGELGNQVFILDSGELECYRLDKQTNQKIFLKKLKEGELFGELSMFYNIPRTATIVCNKKFTLFKLDRLTFTFIMRKKNQEKRQIYNSLISNANIFDQLTDNERQKIFDIILEVTINPNQYLCLEGSVGNQLYIVKSGQFIGVKEKQDGTEEVVRQYEKGDYFGELSLFSKKPRTTSIIATVQICQNRQNQKEALQRLIGPFESILHRNEEIYSRHLQWLLEF